MGVPKMGSGDICSNPRLHANRWFASLVAIGMIAITERWRAQWQAYWEVDGPLEEAVQDADGELWLARHALAEAEACVPRRACVERMFSAPMHV